MFNRVCPSVYRGRTMAFATSALMLIFVALAESATIHDNSYCVPDSSGTWCPRKTDPSICTGLSTNNYCSESVVTPSLCSGPAKTQCKEFGKGDRPTECGAQLRCTNDTLVYDMFDVPISCSELMSVCDAAVH